MELVQLLCDISENQRGPNLFRLILLYTVYLFEEQYVKVREAVQYQYSSGWDVGSANQRWMRYKACSGCQGLAKNIEGALTPYSEFQSVCFGKCKCIIGKIGRGSSRSGRDPSVRVTASHVLSTLQKSIVRTASVHHHQ